MQFKGQPVWVRVDARGRPVLGTDGRAEMKYRQQDEKVYNPAPGNLIPLPDGADDGEPAPRGPRSGPAAPPAAPAARKRPRAPAASAAADGEPEVAPTGAVVDVWTDGACSGNPGPMGIGVVVIADGRRREHGEYLGFGTNNIAELVAIERGLDLAVGAGGDRTRPIRVHSDSGYAIGVLSKGWKAKANQELIARLRDKVATLPRLRLVKVAGHAGVPENERCDALARQAIVKRGTV